MISINVDVESDVNWDKRLIDNNLGTIHQTKSMGKYFKKYNLSPLYLRFEDSTGQIVGQLLARTSEAYNKKNLTGKILMSIPRTKKNALFWNSGPIIFDSKFDKDICMSLTNFILSKNYRIHGTTDPLANSNFSSLSRYFVMKRWSTYLIDLKKSKEKLYNDITKHNGRKNIERSIKRGVIVEKINEKSLIEYHELRNKIKEESQQEITEFERLLDYWKLFQSYGYSGFLAKKDESVVGGLLFSFFNKRIIEGGVARSPIDTKNNLYSQDLIKWKIIEWGQENDMNFYDLAGFNPEPKSKKEEGIKNYKAKWGGQQYDYFIIS